MKILVTVTLCEEHARRIQEVRHDVELIFAWSRAEQIEQIGEVDILLGEALDEQMFHASRRLKWVQVISAGVDGLLFPKFVESDVMLTSAKGYVGRHLAEHAFALLLALTRGIARSVQEKTWKNRWEIRRTAWELTDKTMGIVGFGGTGREVAVRAQAFGMRILAVDPEDQEKPDYVEAVWKMERFRELLSESDVVCICAPLTFETEGMFDREAFRAMRRHAYLINVTRGRIVNEEALMEALQDGLIGGVGLDVTPQEPLPADHPLWEMPHVVITPHVAGASQLRTDREVELFCENLKRFLNGEPMLAVIDKRKGY